MKLIYKSAVVAEINRRIAFFSDINNKQVIDSNLACAIAFAGLRDYLDTIEVKEVDSESEQRMRECPYRRVGCTMYADKILECTGACSWVVDYLNLKKLKAQKGE